MLCVGCAPRTAVVVDERPASDPAPQLVTRDVLEGWRLICIEIPRLIGRGQTDEAKLGANILAREIGAAAEQSNLDAPLAAVNGGALGTGASATKNPPPIADPLAPTIGRAAEALAELEAKK